MAARRRVVRRPKGSPDVALNGYRPTPEEVQRRVISQLAREEAARLLAEARAADAIALPAPGQTLMDDLAEPPSGPKYAVAELHPHGGNSLLVAEKKAGKTTLALNLTRALADGLPFLERFAVEPMDGRVAFLNYEISADLFREWATDLEIQHPERVARPLHIRGRTLPFWESAQLDRIADWLRGEEVEWLIVDPAARAWSGLVDNENDNAKVARFTEALDALKEAAEVPNLLLTTHTGRAKREEGEEAARGATRLEDWADSLWYLTRDRDGARALRATGRDVEVEALDLQFHPDRRLTATGLTRSQRRTEEGIDHAVDALALIEAAGEEPPKTSALEAAMDGDRNKRNAWIQAAVERGLIDRRKHGRALVCSLTDAGRKRHARRVERKPKGGE